MTEKEIETETTKENAKEREDNAGERGTMRNDEDGTMDETQTQSHYLRSIEEPFDSVKNVEGSVVVRDERGEIESDETMVETEKKDFEEGYETEYEYEEKKKSGKKDKMDEDEDTLGRYEFEIEESVAEFEDEEPTERNQIPESSDDSSEDEIDVREKRMKRRRSHDRLALGSSYYTLYEFKEVVLEYALSKRRNIKQDRWDKKKVSFVCGIGKKCKWRIYCSYDTESQKWLLKTKYKFHSCTPDGKCKLLKSPVIARLFLDKLRQKADLMPEEIQQIIKEKWKIVSTRNQCQRGRLIALKWLEKEYEEQFAHLRGYAQEIMVTNQGSTAIVDTYKNKAGEDVFNGFYVCFGILRDTWRGYCRPIIGVDGTFLKRAVKGVLLTAVGQLIVGYGLSRN
ncbi:uncharacterized protein LOC103835555 isoform X1 [Brassica rapa]|uniref:uncharacterized protein LOC103835555 isoform X1 n=1 Tax=Brassica campestris TaxID=3711 RepID=UPI0008730605|nr:uncharacterized protein LOC103835555 isoform X1 [Brassica rapa]